MSIKVTDFKWEKGKNDLEYIALLEKNRDVMMNNLRECSKIAKEQYNKGRADRDKEIAEHNVFFSNKPIEDIVLDARADERANVLNEVLGLKPQIYTWLIKREKGGYGTTLGECTDKIFEEIEKVFKSHK